MSNESDDIFDFKLIDGLILKFGEPELKKGLALGKRKIQKNTDVIVTSIDIFYENKMCVIGK